MRLRHGITELEVQAPERAARVRERARDAVARMSATFPGDSTTGLLDQSREMYDRWNDFANDEVCPALDPENKTCELYQSRPLTCRTFGPPIMSEGELGVCELCFDGAPEEEIIAAEMRPDPDNVEAELLKEIEASGISSGETIIAFVLAR